MLTPTLAHPPIRHGQGDPTAAEQAVLNLLDRAGLLGLLARAGLLDGTVDKIARDSLQYVPFTQLANLTGTPAMSVPLHWTADGLPLGVQFVARFGEEDRLLQLAAATRNRAAVVHPASRLGDAGLALHRHGRRPLKEFVPSGSLSPAERNLLMGLRLAPSVQHWRHPIR